MGDRRSRENRAGRVSPPRERVDGGDLVSSSTGLVKRRTAPKLPRPSFRTGRFSSQATCREGLQSPAGRLGAPRQGSGHQDEPWRCGHWHRDEQHRLPLTAASAIKASPPFLTCLQPYGTVRSTLSFVNVSTRIASDQKESDDALCQSWPT